MIDVNKIDTPEKCDIYATNCGKKERHDLARLAKKRKVKLRAELYGAETEVEIQCAQAIFAYEEVRSELKGKKTIATRTCLLYTSPSPRDATLSRMPSSA